MTKIFSVEDMKQANGEAALIRKAYNEETWEEFKKCTYAFFPGCKLTGAEPELVIKAYDSIRFQNPDTGIFLYCCGIPAKVEGNDTLLDETLAEIKAGWESLGKPTLIVGCLGCYNTIKSNLPEIPMVTIFKFLKDMEISGGCNSVDYFIKAPAGSDIADETAAIMKELAEDMGVKLHEDTEEGDYPYLTCSIKDRDALKRQGRDAAHILELIYGMGASNVHLEHEHDHDHEDSCDCGEDECSCDETAAGNDIADKIAAAMEEVGCDGICSSCSSACGAYDGPAIPAPLPTVEESQQNRIELKQAMLEFFFNEF